MNESSSGPPDKREYEKIHFNESSKDNKAIKNNYIPICSYLISNNINLNNKNLEDLPDFVQLLKSSSCKDKNHHNKDSNKMLNKKDFTEIFLFLFKKTKDKYNISKRLLNRVNTNQRNILFAYFSLKYTNKMKEIASNSFDFKFKDRINNKKDFLKKWNQYVDDLLSIKYGIIRPIIQNDTLSEDDVNDQEIVNDLSFERVDNQQENPYVNFSNDYIYNDDDTYLVFTSNENDIDTEYKETYKINDANYIIFENW